MKKLGWQLFLAVLLAFLVWWQDAKAESFFHMEAGLGIATSKDVGDGTWVQSGVAVNRENLVTPAFMAGFSGDITNHIGWHADYVYFGTQSASCICVPDSAYNAHTHTASEVGYIPFSGSGHVQGIAFTLEPYTYWHGYRLAIEGGPWLVWNTWHESRLDPAYPSETDLSHKTVMQVSWIAGASVGRGNMSLSYRYYRIPQKWNPYPGLLTGTHMVMMTYRF